MKKVLYIDDEADSEKMASKFELLRSENIDLIPLTRVKDVLPTLSSFEDSIGLVVLDIIMPPEDSYSLEETDGGTTTGVRLLEDIRSRFQHIPIIIVSVRRHNFVDEVEARHNIHAYLQKPISAYTLAKAIKSALNTPE